MGLVQNLLICALVIIFSENVLGRKGDKIPCPDERDIVCVDCECDAATGFNSCKPASGCPAAVKSASEVKKKDKKSKCPYGRKFISQCTLCECSGEGGDHCAMCFALPVRKADQPEAVNKQLPQPTDNRFFNYEINGWDRREEE